MRTPGVESAELETARLRLRQWRDDDGDELARIHSDPEVMRFIGPARRPQSRDEADAWLARQRDHWLMFGFGIWAMELKATGELIGWAGATTLNWLPKEMPAIEIGWLLDRPYWREGLATEAGAAVLRFAFEKLGLKRVVAIHQAENAASRRVMEKIGMRYVRERRHPRAPIRLLVFEALRTAGDEG